MKFTLKDYQDDAVKDVLDRLKRARRRWHEENDKNAFSLTATTGAGKTVMAAAAFEALLYGNDDYDFERDPGAVVIWFSDDPSLNEQSRWRLQEASDKLTVSDLITVENTFAREKFEPRKVYFLNTGKLSKNSLLVRGHDAADPAIDRDDRQLPIMPDLRSHTIWDTIQHTIEDPDLTLYLVLDEAHRGIQSAPGEKPTIVKRLINGAGTVPGIPVVWGISATVQRFNDAIAGMQGHTMLPNVVVDPTRVQGSGLLKDTINLDVPDDTGNVSTVLLRRGTEKLRDVSAAWAEYAKQQEDADTVLPLMVLQVPNSPDHREIGSWLDTVFDHWPELPPDCVANVFGEHRTETFGSRTAPYIAPERVQESSWVRILVAKDAISTGWDCPRAEVMVSFRAASDKVHIAQLLGRMVRTPLARRIPGNERLNAVDCILPKFDKKSVEAVAKALMTGSEAGDELPGRRILINPQEMKPNPDVPEDVWETLLGLPSQTLPKRQARPVKRLTALAHELAADALLPDAGKKAHAEMHKLLDGARVRYADEIKEARDRVLEVEGKTLRADAMSKAMTFNDFVEAADFAVIEDAYKRAARVISPDLATTYSEHLAGAANDQEEALIEAHTVVAALGLVPDIRADLDREAEKLSNQWLTQFRVPIKGLSDERQEVYRQIREMSADPLDVDLARPTVSLQPTSVLQADGKESELPRFERHMLCDEKKLFPANFGSSWESKVVEAELQRPATVAWYRNPARASQDSLGVMYEAAPLSWSVAGLGSSRFCGDVLNGGFVGHGRAIAEGGMQPYWVVPAFDEAEAGHTRFCLGCEPAAIQQLAFERGKEALAHGVVIDVADRAHRGPHAGFLAALTERQGRVLASLIAVMDHVARAALPDRHFQRVHHQLGAQMSGHRPAHDFAAPGVQHHGEIEEPVGSGHEGDIGNPQLVRRRCREVAIHQVRRRPGVRVASRGCHATAATAGANQPGCTHQPRNALAAMLLPSGPQLGMHTRGAIGLARARVNGPHPLQQRGVGNRVRRRRALPPGVEPGFGHAEHACHGRDREAGLVRAHEFEDPDGIAPVSRANQAAARERISRSSRSCLFSRRSRANSSRSAAASPSPFSSRRPSLRSACATHWQIDCAVGSNSRASSVGSRPARTNSTI